MKYFLHIDQIECRKRNYMTNYIKRVLGTSTDISWKIFENCKTP